ncbi:kinase-like protein [Aspergillus steynii IBT 23096]|uniref:Kinase-like protein n=1 Tax=Aspergillus steynii IBT 23096 TaxID=1392250 RepID=A0A2I2GEB7_9EURO|nr:kinase-like protein [Aspergillus steynii IBT 23096]PLB51202.1 kinase-like protein [Aspergillus steynii IBT 23096]
MSMFRSAADSSSSDSESSSSHDGIETAEVTIDSAAQKTQKKGKSTTTPPLLTRGDHEPGDQGSIEGLDVGADRHSSMLTAALLEFFCITRATDILNIQQPHMQYSRDSPESQALGKRMYEHKSQFLSSRGVVATGVHKEELGPARQYYRDNLDLLGISALEDLNIGDIQGQVSPLDSDGKLALAPKPSNTMQILSNPGYASLPSPKFRAPPRHPGFGRDAIKNFRLDLSSLPALSSPLSGNSPVGFPLFDQNTQTPTEKTSRYASEFSEVNIVGRGSFGEVYHVINHIDGQSYAVKKIPISQRRLEQLQCGGENQLEAIMKEIRTLARLEHKNVVRYYSAWVEKARLASYVPPDPQGSVKTEDTQTESLTLDSHDDQSFGVVFGHSEDSAADIKSEPLGEDDEEIESIPRDFTGPSLSTFGGTDNDIFTDGLSNDASQLQVQRRPRDAPALVLHIQMSLHPISLGSYLSPEPGKAALDHEEIPRRHCFHLVPSLKMMMRIISGVDYLHAKGIVHRDLKPANIFLSSPETKRLDGCLPCESAHQTSLRYCHPRIGDFGLVADISHITEQSPTTPTSALQSGAKVHRVVGTEFYRPPFVNSEAGTPTDPGNPNTPSFYTIDESLDIYALGVILFELLYRLNTKMERQLVLSDLTRAPQGQTPTGPSFPTDFAHKVDMGDLVLDNGSSIADSLMACIRGMMDPLPTQRWTCMHTKKYLQDILAVAEKACAESFTHAE